MADVALGIGGVAVRVLTEEVMPGLQGTGMSTHQVTMGPCTSLAPHYHPSADELQYVVEGKWRAGAAGRRRAAGPCGRASGPGRCAGTASRDPW